MSRGISLHEVYYAEPAKAEVPEPSTPALDKVDTIITDLKVMFDEHEQWLLKREQWWADYHAKYPTAWLKGTLAWRCKVMRGPPNMILIHGFLEADLKDRSISLLKKGLILASGRAVKEKLLGNDNTAGHWLRNASIIYKKLQSLQHTR